MTRDHVPHDGPMTPEERLRALLGDGLDGQPPTPEEASAARLTAHALGELSPAEAAEVERHLATSAAPGEQALVAETRALAETLRRPVPSAGVPREPVGSPSLRTAVTAALAAGGRAKGTPSATTGRAPREPARSWPVLPLLVATGGTAAALLALIVSFDGRNEIGVVPGTPPVDAPAATVAARRRSESIALPAAAPPADAKEAVPGGDASGAVLARAKAPVIDDVGGIKEVAELEEVAESASSASPETNAFAAASTSPLAAAAAPRVLAAKKMELDAATPAGGPPGFASGPAPADDVAGSLSADKRRLRTAPSSAEGPPARGNGVRGTRFGGQGGAAPGMSGESVPPALGGIPFQPAERGEEKMIQGQVPGAGGLAKGMGMAPLPDAEGREWFQERDLAQRSFDRTPPGSERYARFVENSFRDPAEKDQALSTFSIDVDTASYALVRRFIHDRRVPPPDAVRLEEMLNYFRYDDPAPAGDDPLAVRVESAACPWQPGRRLLRVALKGRDIAPSARPGTSLVFLVDVSGSMNEPNKLPLVKQALSMLVEQLAETDTVAIVTYAGEAGVRLPPTSGDQKGRIRDAVESLSAGGSTNGSAGIEVAYRLAQEAFVKGGSNRVILATDGDLNVGITDDAALVGLIKEKAGSGVFLTVLGFGRGNLQDEKMEKLADNGNGIYAYIDGAREARKVLVEQLTGSTLTIAKDVKIQIEFNPARVAAYRLLGYENRILAARDFKDDTKDAGEVGAGHGVTALYEIVPTGVAAEGTDDVPLKYQPSAPRKAARPAADDSSPELCTVHLRWKAPEASESVERDIPFEDRGGSFEEASADLRFAAAVAEFGMLLRESRHRGRASLNHVTATAAGALANDPGGLRAEFLDLVREAGALLPHGGRGAPN